MPTQLGDLMPQRGRKPLELWELPPHTAAKHALLKSYLGAWFPIMAKYNGRIVYYDAFAGPGETKGAIDGSPLIALKTLLDHDHFDLMKSTEFLFLFNEQDAGCAENLERLVGELKTSKKAWPKNVTVEVNNDSFVNLTTEIVDDLEARKRNLAPTFAFVDPVGVKATPMDTLRRLTDFDKGEMLLYFAHEFVVRQCDAGVIDKALTDLFGTTDYKDAGVLNGAQRSQFLHDLYKRQLHDVCRFPYIQSFAMYDKRGKRLYDLYYCTREPLGMDRMKQAMWRVAPTGDYTFHDRLANQDVLFSADIDTEPLQDHLLTHFAGQAVDIQTVIDHVIVATPYHSSHVKRRTLAVLQRAGRISSPNQAKVNTYPNGTIIQFP
jgi:three-Cys-motif partner protein